MCIAKTIGLPDEKIVNCSWEKVFKKIPYRGHVYDFVGWPEVLLPYPATSRKGIVKQDIEGLSYFNVERLP